MTLILTYLSPDAVVQVSDCRVVRRGAAREREDLTRKLIHYMGPEADLAISYTGLVDIYEPGQPHRSIESWLAETISQSGATRTDEMLNQLLPKLAAAVDQTRSATGAGGAQTKLTVLWVGFVAGKQHPWVLSMSNFEALGHQVNITSGEACLAAVPGNAAATVGIFSMNWADYSGLAPTVLCHGDLTGLTPSVIQELNDCVRNGHALERNLAVRDCLVSAVRAGAEHSTDRTISRDCWSVILERGNHISEYASHFEGTKSTVVDPMAIGLGFSAQMVTNVPATSASERYAIMLQSGRRGIELNADSLRAAIDQSALLTRWGTLFERRGHTVDYGSFFDLVGMVRHAGILYAESIEPHLAKAAGWAELFFEDYITKTEDKARGWSGQSIFSMSKDTLLQLVLIALDPRRFNDDVLQDKFGMPSREDVRSLAARHMSRKTM